MTTFDVAIVGGGINGACLYHQLCERGYRVLLVDRGDFACGTSQASAMMAWGGLLYLRNLDFKAVWEFSAARDAMIADMPGRVERRSFRYIPAARDGRSKHLVHAALYLYWLVGRLRQHRPRLEKRFAEEELLRADMRGPNSLLYEEGVLSFSDSRFVLQWISPHGNAGQVALNYGRLAGGEFCRRERLWHLDLEDELGDRNVSARARCVVNCAGVWTDEVNRSFGIHSPIRHAFSKGVFIGFERHPEHRVPLIFDAGEHGDAISFIPWGPVALWGPTETAVQSPEEGCRMVDEDVDFLLRHARRLLNGKFDAKHIVSLRCGVRPLPIESDCSEEVHPMKLSRRHRVVVDANRPWISTYGGKITGCALLARQLEGHIKRMAAPTGEVRGGESLDAAIGAWGTFPGLEERVPALDWCMEREYCCTLEDYMRRRTNIAQWVAREGLGKEDENGPFLYQLALQLSDGDPLRAERQIETYREQVHARFDQLTGRVYHDY